MKQTYIAYLQQEIVQVFGHPVLSFSDCYRLAEEVFEKTGLRISVNTLRRFFNLIAAKYPPSYNTLTILSKACGYNSFDEFVQLRDSKAAQAGQPDRALLKFMVALFQQVPAAGVQDATYRSFVRLTITYLISNPGMADPLQKQIARTRNGQDVYFEQFINTDHLARFYGEGLRYYLNEKRQPEAQLFGRSLLCLRAWLVMDDAAFEMHYEQLHGYAAPQNRTPALQARYFAVQLFYAQLHQLPVVPILEEARSAYNQLAHTKESARVFPWFEAILTKALVLTHQFEEALFYIVQASKRRTRYAVPQEEQLLFKNFEVYEALALAALKKASKAELLYERLRNAKFYFLDQQYLSILLLHLERGLHKKRFSEEKFAYLIKETGFARLLQWSLHAEKADKLI